MLWKGVEPDFDPYRRARKGSSSQRRPHRKPKRGETPRKKRRLPGKEKIEPYQHDGRI